MDDTHECPARGCRARVRPDYLMCGFHWRMVPQETRSAVWRAWRGGLGLGSDEHVAAMRAAIASAGAGEAAARG